MDSASWTSPAMTPTRSGVVAFTLEAIRSKVSAQVAGCKRPPLRRNGWSRR